MKAMPSDTTIDVLRKQFEILHRLGLKNRAEIAFQLSDNLRQIAEEGVRLRNPEYNDHQVRREVLRITLGGKLYHKAFEEGDKNK